MTARLSTGAKVGLGVGLTCTCLLCIALYAFWLWRSSRKLKALKVVQTKDPEMKTHTSRIDSSLQRDRLHIDKVDATIIARESMTKERSVEGPARILTQGGLPNLDLDTTPVLLRQDHVIGCAAVEAEEDKADAAMLGEIMIV